MSEYFHYDSLTRYEDEFEHLQSQAISNYNENVVYESQYQQLYENLLEGFINNIALITKLIGMVQMITLENGETIMKLIFNLFVNVLSISYIEVSLDDSTSTVLKEKELKDALITHCSSMNNLECSENAVLRYIFMKGIGS